jgi:hypothetical protein
MINYFIDIGMLISFLSLFITGIIKFPGLSLYLGDAYFAIPFYIITPIHDWSGVSFGIMAILHIVLHWRWMVAMTKSTVKKAGKRFMYGALTLFLLIILSLSLLSLQYYSPGTVETNGSKIIGGVSDAGIKYIGTVMIQNVGTFEFDPDSVKTVREDIFTDGHFSVFDILAHLDEAGSIEMEYHFDETMNTNVIDSINGKETWWYMAYYDGGWAENNVYRMDHYPYKDKMYIRVEQTSEQSINGIYEVFREEVERKQGNDGNVIIPLVLISGPTTNLRLENVQVAAHNLRNDSLQAGVITGIDVIMSLGDQNKLTYDLKWYDSIGSASVVRSYWVDRINQDQSHGRCGFVYEAGSLKFRGFRGNHIHLPSDMRTLNSPEYVEFFWICL